MGNSSALGNHADTDHQERAEALKAELDRLRKVERAKNIEAIAEARAHGDLSENAEYDAAKERQGFIESRIVELKPSWPTPVSSKPPGESPRPSCSAPRCS